MPVRPNPFPPMIQLLLNDPNVTNLCDNATYGALIFAGKVPPFAVDLMPACAVVLSNAGGFPESLTVPEHNYRVQATCYGGGAGSDATDEEMASRMASAVTDCLVKTDRNRIVVGTTLIHEILYSGGPTQVKDVDMNNTPAMVVFLRVMMPAVALVAPF